MTQANGFNFWITQSENQSILQKKQSETFLVILIDMMSIGISNEMNEMHTFIIHFHNGNLIKGSVYDCISIPITYFLWCLYSYVITEKTTQGIHESIKHTYMTKTLYM